MIRFSEEQLQIIYDRALSTYPQECCGIIVGVHNSVVEVIPTENVWANFVETFPETSLHGETERYAIAPFEMLRVQKQARDRHLEIIGIFHSHPDHPAIPSECDRLYAWQEYSYVIISIQKGVLGELTSWRLDEHHQFQPEEIEKIV
ncbi:Mov34/MPN/PAD-1 family protein [Iningainema tapete]|uniref:M67 family metallopeptidase n=1 Tax=Iningainema tapete BLCC-T55 TaxID=2748662 RepID=A0A8J6XVF6_9CYAN|nr:M67 family metallopeptidase [Iningainema tapete]MBD2776887.1 M67 family metallopeptidase [Iningainema tapete BLCC-T55]